MNLTPRVFAKVNNREVRSNDSVVIEVKTRYAVFYKKDGKILILRREHGFLRGIQHVVFILIEKPHRWVTSPFLDPLSEKEIEEVKRDVKSALRLLGSDCIFVDAGDLPKVGNEFHK